MSRSTPFVKATNTLPDHDIYATPRRCACGCGQPLGRDKRTRFASPECANQARGKGRYRDVAAQLAGRPW